MRDIGPGTCLGVLLLSEFRETLPNYTATVTGYVESDRTTDASTRGLTVQHPPQ